MVYSTLSILSTIPTLAKFVWEHTKINPIKVEWLKKMLDNKEVALVKQAGEVDVMSPHNLNSIKQIWYIFFLL